MTPELEARMDAASAAIRAAIDRWDRPTPYRSYAEYQHALADAYRARAAVWEEALTYVYEHFHATTGLLYTALHQARAHDEGAARDSDREARLALVRTSSTVGRTYGRTATGAA